MAVSFIPHSIAWIHCRRSGETRAAISAFPGACVSLWQECFSETTSNIGGIKTLTKDVTATMPCGIGICQDCSQQVYIPDVERRFVQAYYYGEPAGTQWNILILLGIRQFAFFWAWTVSIRQRRVSWIYPCLGMIVVSSWFYDTHLLRHFAACETALFLHFTRFVAGAIALISNFA